MIVCATLAEQPEPRRSTLCEACGQLFSIPYKDWNPAGFSYCPSCQAKRNRLAMLYMQLKEMKRFGHTPSEINGHQDCELCSIQNQIDDLRTGGYNWRDDHEERLDNLPTTDHKY